MTKDPGRKPPASMAGENLQEEIRYRAYELYEERGRGDGHDLEDWLRAEEEITKQKAHIIAA